MTWDFVRAAWTECLAWDFGRYVGVAGVAFLVIAVWGRKRFTPRLIQGRWAAVKDMRREVKYSLSTIVIFSLIGTSVKLCERAGLNRAYDNVALRGWPYFFASIALLIVLHDTYFYWTHRLMHHRWLFKHVHRVHHLSSNPSPWAAYAFAPGEAIMQAAYVPLFALLIPVHEIAIFAFVSFMIVRNVIGHAGVELLPRAFVRHPLASWSTTTTHHAMHHRRSDANYGLYFTFWDGVMGTTHPDYEPTFESIAGR